MMAGMETIVDVDKGDLDGEMSAEGLTFQEIPHSTSSGSEGHGISGRDKSQTHTFTNFPNPEESDEEEDNTDLLEGTKKVPSFWTFEYYQMFFDVESYQVLGRILGSMLPNPRKNYLQYQIRPNPDLYGPFWICTTLVFTTAIAGNMANYFQHHGKDYEWRYDFHKVTFAATAIFSYWWVIPAMLWGLLWWRGNPAGFTFLELICVYGYSLAIYIPISILWVVQLNWLQWLLVLLGMILSGSVLLMTLWPAVKDDDRKVAAGTMAMVFLFHGLLAVGFVLYFFHVPDIGASTIGPGLNVTTAKPTTLLNTGEQQSRLPPGPPLTQGILPVPQSPPQSQQQTGNLAAQQRVDDKISQLKSQQPSHQISPQAPPHAPQAASKSERSLEQPVAPLSDKALQSLVRSAFKSPDNERGV